MVLCQVEAARLKEVVYPPHLGLLSFTGTLAIYGLDRWVECQHVSVLESRHRGSTWSVWLFTVFLSGSVFFLTPKLDVALVAWLGSLGGLGLLYLAITASCLPSFPTLKELLGAFCFTYLVWGPFSPVRLDIAFFLLGISNFLWSSDQDRKRDHLNGVRSLALKAPHLNLGLARLLALAAALLFFKQWSMQTPFFPMAILHALWPHRRELSIDWAFIPLLWIPLFHLTTSLLLPP